MLETIPEVTPEALAEPTKTVSVVYGWRFVGADGTSIYQATAQELGVRYTVPDADKPISVTRYGFHVSSDPLVAINGGLGFFIERAKLSGTLDIGPEAVAGSERTPLWRADAQKLLSGFAADCAERAAKYIAARNIEPTAQTARYIQLARDFATGAKSVAQMHDETDGFEWTVNAAVGAAEVEQAAIHAARIFSGYECVDCALFDAADAIGYGASQDKQASATGDVSGDGAFVGERLWQAYDLHERLMKLAPPGYSEPLGEPYV